MAIYAIGDIQGCFDEFKALLEKLQFNPGQDNLWLTGDLVNRGPDSLKVLRYVRDLGESAVTVLGNHDLHLLAIAYVGDKKRTEDTFDELLSAPDKDELLDWLRHRPLMHTAETVGYTLVHAGLSPHWTLADARQYAYEVEHVLRGQHYRHYFVHMYGDEPAQWSANLKRWDHLRYITNCFTRLRYVDLEGRLCLKFKGSPEEKPSDYIPWFKVGGRKSKDNRIIFGHWAALGFHDEDGVIGLDTGCLWGGMLTAVKLDGPPGSKLEPISLPCGRVCDPKDF